MNLGKTWKGKSYVMVSTLKQFEIPARMRYAQTATTRTLTNGEATSQTEQGSLGK